MNRVLARDDLVRRLAAALRAISLYSPGHPLIGRTVSSLFEICDCWFAEQASLVVGFLDSDVVVDNVPVRQAGGVLTGLVRTLARQQIEKITFLRDLTADELSRALEIIGDNGAARGDVAGRLVGAGIHHVTVGAVTVEDTEQRPPGIQAAIRVYDAAMRTAETFWQNARDGKMPDTAAARKIINSLAQVVTDDRPSMLALTTLKRHDAYTFTHMLNVSVLTMAVGRTLGLEPGLVREFGLAALMHDIGKSRTPIEILNKPGQLSASELAIMKRHPVDGAEMLWEMSDMPPLAAMVAFEHHLRHDQTGYPAGATRRELNLCTLVVSIGDVFDALRTHRPYRAALASERVRAMLAEQNGTAFHPSLLKRFINVVGLFPVGSLVRMDDGTIGIVTYEHPEDPLRPQVKVVMDRGGQRLPESYLVNTWERRLDGRRIPAATEAVEPGEVGLDPVALLCEARLGPPAM